jgi:diguanylate cyclase (GGDEF)-like protein
VAESDLNTAGSTVAPEHARAVTRSAGGTAHTRPVEAAQTLVARAWELCYLDPLASREIGRRLVDQGGSWAAQGWLQVALAEVRVGDTTLALDALRRARAGFTGQADKIGVALCDEVQAIALRRAGDFEGSARLQAVLDQRDDIVRQPMHEYISLNSRAITTKLLGDSDKALRLFYSALDAASRTGWIGPRITALSNLGGYHQDLFNLEDARTLSEQALSMAREAGARQAIVTTAITLIIVYHAIGEMQQSRAMAEFLITNNDSLGLGDIKRLTLPLALGHLAVGEIDEALRKLEPGTSGALSDDDGMTFWAWMKTRCLLAKGDAVAARDVAERTLRMRRQRGMVDQPYDTMALLRALADACETAGDPAAALSFLREAHARYEQLVGRSARARYTALQVVHQLAETQRERDVAVDSRRTVEDDRRRLVELNAALQVQAAETEMLHAKLREQALRDPLTGLHNRRYLFEMSPGLLELARRQAGTVCVVLMDLDHFKLLNDTYGHAAGDVVLQRFSSLLTQMLRRSDVVCRYGGEEFVAVMPDIDGEGALAMLSRLLEAFQEQQSDLGRKRLPRGSFSAGIAQFPRHGSTLEQLLSRADRGLYSAKNHGRARIEMAPRTGFGTLT